MKYQNLKEEIKSLGNKEFAKHHSKFFQTQKGGYGEGDLFYGIKVPVLRELSKKYINLSLEDIDILLKDKYHEVRMIALFILVLKFKKYENEQQKIYDLYLKNTKYADNWDLVDCSASYIVGSYLYSKKNYDILYKLSKSENLWEQRISIVATHYLIKQKEFEPTLKLCEYFLSHPHHLIHKAAGWMLREAGKIDTDTLYKFLDKFYKKMPRTMLRYSIERLPLQKKKYYMS